MTKEHSANIALVHEFTGTHDLEIRKVKGTYGTYELEYCKHCGFLDTEYVSGGVHALKKAGLKSIAKSAKNLNSNFAQVLVDEKGRKYFYWHGHLKRPSTITAPVTSWARGLALMIQHIGKHAILEFPKECAATLERMKNIDEFKHLLR